MRCVKSFLSYSIVLLMAASLAAPAFAGEYRTGIDAFSYGAYEIPAYDGDSTEEVNGNLPAFSAEEMTQVPSVYYGELDELGRCTPAFAELNQSLMPSGSRGSISSVYPSGWVQKKYDVVSSSWLYNRCHLIGWQLTGADLNTLPKEELAKNLITGTRYLNVGDGQTGMVGCENEVASYLREDEDNFVSYRVSPVFQGNNLVASGVLMEGQSAASNDVEFCVFCYNVQPQIAIDYETGESILASAVPENTPITDCLISAERKVICTGQPVAVPLTITDGDKLLQEGVDYETVYSYNLLPGRATVQIAGIGSYKGVCTLQFVIVPGKAKVRKITALKKGKFRIEISPQDGVSGYKISYREKGKKKWTTVLARKNVRTLKGLKAKKSYQIRVRAYKDIDGKSWYGKWSKVRTAKAIR